MEMPGISVVIWLHDTREAYFRDLLESLVSQTYHRWELHGICGYGIGVFSGR